MATKNNTNRRSPSDRNLLLFIIILFFIVLIRNAWVSDDAYITFRTIENFIHGHGLTYNVGERVQTYTHPLWMFLLTGMYYGGLRVFGDHQFGGLYYVSIAASLTFSLAAVALLSFKLSKSTRSAILSILVLTLSKAFIDFSASGLENPLTHFLLALFLLVYFSYKKDTQKRLLFLSLITGVAALNRLDTILLLLPALLHEYWTKHRNLAGLKTAALGMLPLILWEIFSLIYYGFLFPNTAYAKLNTGIPQSLLNIQGMLYFLNSLDWDPITLLATGFAVMQIAFTRKYKEAALIAGVVLYLLYVIRIGGDFMSGRFLAAPLFIAAALISRLNVHKDNRYFIYILIFGVIGITSPRSPLLSDSYYPATLSFEEKLDKRGISDERAFYYETTGFLFTSRENEFPAARWLWGFWEYDEEERTVQISNASGVIGYESGPSVHWIDNNALLDALLARLPIRDAEKWRIGRIGHFKRATPVGYLETLESGDNMISDAYLRVYYEKLSTVITGRLFTRERWIEIWNFNTGRYDELITRYVEGNSTN